MKSNQELKKFFNLFIYFACGKNIMSCLLLMSIIYTGKAPAQQQQTWYAVSYYKILPGKERELRTMMEAVDARVQKERVNSGAISAWHFYEVLSPRGSAGYDYVSITTTNSFKKIYETPYTFDSAFKKIFTGKDAKFFADYYSKMSEGLTLFKEEIYSGIALADSSTLDGFQSRYVVIDYMQPKPGKDGDYVKKELDTFRLIHRERIKLGAINQWALLVYVFPWNLKKEYSYIAANFQKDFDITSDNKYEEATKKTFPAVSSVYDLFRSASAMNDNTEADILRLVLYASPVK
jgi:hypothetical protein